MSSRRFITGFGKAVIYLRIILHIPLRYARRPGMFASPAAYFRFLRRAMRLLLVFRHNKTVRTPAGYKLHLYLPAYPSPAFFYAIESKLLRSPAGPTTIVYSMTKACPCRCEHCYQRRDANEDLDEPLMIETALAVRDTGVAFFDIEGGEPFARFPRLLRLVQSLDARSEIWVNTSGMLATPEKLAGLKQAGVLGLMVSIHSPDRSRHDALTNVEGSFDAACDTIRAARQAGLSVAANTVLSEEEIRGGGLDRLMAFTRSLGCDFVQLIHPKPAGQWIGRREDMQSDPALIDFIRKEHVRYNSSGMRSFPALAAQVFEEQRGVLGCTAGAIDRFYVGASGEVQPCEFLNLSFGNIRTEPFDIIFQRMRSYFPSACTDWLCCTQAAAIQQLIEAHGITETPVPWETTRELVEHWDRGDPTPVYDKLGIYR